MDFLKSQFARLQQQFNQLNASQKMLSVALLAIMAMTLVMWGRYAGTAEMEPLLDQDLTSEELGKITMDLKGRGIPYTTNGNRVLVPADRKYEVIASLGYDQALPKDTSGAFTDLMAKMDNPLNSPEKTAMIQNEARQAALAEVIRKFPHVSAARVMIDPTSKRGFNNPVNPGASIFIKMESGYKADPQLVGAAADFVCGSVAGLQRSNVKVIVDGVSRLFSADDSADAAAYGAGEAWVEAVRKTEKLYNDAVAGQLKFCEGVLVHVSVRFKDESSEIREEKFDPKASVSKEVESETETQNVAGANRGTAGDVGVNPNTGSNHGMSIAASAGVGDGGSTFEKTRTKTENHVGVTSKTTRSPAGSAVPVSVSVGVPRSYFVKAYKSRTHTDKEPADSILTDFMSREILKYRSLVASALPVPSEDVVKVEAYTDLAPAIAEVAPAVTGGVSMFVGGHAKEIALSALAVISLFMVSMMVRKSGPALATAGGPMLAGAGVAGATVDTILATSGGGSAKLAREDAAAEVAEGRGALEGVELDSEAVHSQQVVEQVAGLVKENPDSAAAMIKRWMNRA